MKPPYLRQSILAQTSITKATNILSHVRYSRIKGKDRFLLTLWLMNFACQPTIIYSVATSMNWYKLYPKPRQDRAWSYDKTHSRSQTKGALAKIQYLAVSMPETLQYQAKCSYLESCSSGPLVILFHFILHLGSLCSWSINTIILFYYPTLKYLQIFPRFFRNAADEATDLDF